MKKITAITLILALVISVFAGCSKQGGSSETSEIRLGGLKGPTSMGMVKLLDDAEKGLTQNIYDFTMAGSADELTPKFLKGEIDVLAVPANLGSVLYNKSEGGARVIAINTLGILYIVEKGGNTVNSLSDLKGRTLYATGKGSTPQYSLEYLLAESGLDPEKDVDIQWKSEPTEVVALMATTENAVAMLPQPYVTVAGNQLENLRIAVNLTEVWNSVNSSSEMITAVLIVRTEFAEKNPETVKKFLEEYAKSTAFVNENTDEASELIEKYGITKAAVAKKAIPYCNIVCITGSEMEQALKGYFDVLNGRNPASLGGKLPGEEFYLK